MLLPRSLPAARRLPAAVALGRRRLATPAARPQPLKLAIIGAGPSGLYAASRILAQLPADDDKSQVHVYERLPAPHGLVRYGVAPDHPEVKVRRPLQSLPACAASGLSAVLPNPSRMFSTSLTFSPTTLDLASLETSSSARARLPRARQLRQPRAAAATAAASLRDRPTLTLPPFGCRSSLSCPTTRTSSFLTARRSRHLCRIRQARPRPRRRSSTSSLHSPL